ncbi:major facilitator superfamily MFS-1 [Rickenella mellea]|uniref:Major facilitator superfamily MFS-1 n=1 Tax=Rickenella mellea TaxID=50990 RepID=A0A4Y7QD26_9AGAM|nr:major facilitator superfamily MFS-1 [Rickenella mellea]
MSKPNLIPIPPNPLAEQENAGLEADDLLTPTPETRRPRVSFSQRTHRPSRGAHWKPFLDEESGLQSPSATERPPIPSALTTPGEPFSTPLPVMPMIVLSITMLGEFLSANVSTPFVLFMVEGFGGFHDEGDVGYWTGLLVSCFFITQFLTSLLWATAAERHGARAVLFVSLLGSSLTCVLFGTAKTMPQAMTIRLLQGVFAGAIGVGRGNVTTMTDPSNEGRAYAILGFCWGFGGVAGAIIGGAFESPAKKWPGVFSSITLFVNYPYLLPTMIASAITFTGSIMALFLNYNGGPRDGSIRLPPEKIGVDAIPEETSTVSDEVEPPPPNLVNQIKKKVSKKFSGYFAKRVQETLVPSSPSPGAPSSLPLASSPRNITKMRTFSRTSRANGSAYGYGSAYRSRLASNVSQTFAGRRGSMASSVARQRGSNVDGPGLMPEGQELNFAQRLLMANENAVTNIADLWVAAAMNVDNEDPFESDTEMGMDDVIQDPFEDDDENLTTPARGRQPSTSASTSASRLPALPGPRLSFSHRPSGTSFRPQLPSSRHDSPGIGTPPARYSSPSQLAANMTNLVQESPRRFSSTVPSIFSHTGVRTPPAVVEAAQPLQPRETPDAQAEGLSPIIEGRTQAQVTPAGAVDSVPEKPPSTWSQLPILIIIQYGLLALHSTTHDQVFLSYLTSKYETGGLNLNAGKFAQLIALMCLAQMAYQFYLYPNMGPPRGRFSHLAMFRIGSLLFIPSYLSVILYRPLASPTDSGNLVVMTGLALSTALRYCGITFAYTAIAILLNYMSPPHLLGLANGIAQSIVSLARFVGPIVGGYLWSESVEGGPSGYPLGFLVCSGVTAIAVAQSFFIR